MNMQRSAPLSLAAAIALSLFGMTAVATAQTPSPPPPPPAAPPAPSMQHVPPPPAVPPAPSMQRVPPPAALPAPQVPPAVQQQGASEFYPGTQSSATYPIPNGTLTVNTGMPEHVQSYGSPPAFKLLDTNHDGRINESEAQTYPPLDSDFLYVSNNGKSISHTQYAKWVQGQH